MYVNRKENWFWDIGNGKVYCETWSPGKINLSDGKVVWNLFLWKRVQTLDIYDNLS